MGNPYETLSYNVRKNERVMYLQAAALIPCPGLSRASHFRSGRVMDPSGISPMAACMIPRDVDYL